MHIFEPGCLDLGEWSLFADVLSTSCNSTYFGLYALNTTCIHARLEKKKIQFLSKDFEKLVQQGTFWLLFFVTGSINFLK